MWMRQNMSHKMIENAEDFLFEFELISNKISTVTLATRARLVFILSLVVGRVQWAMLIYNANLIPLVTYILLAKINIYIQTVTFATKGVL